MKRKINILLLMLLSLTIIIVGCNNDPDSGTGTISLSLTDAPLTDAEDVEGVFVTIESIAYNLNDEWITAENFQGPQVYNLLELTGGSVAPLADTSIAAGEVSQIRFILVANERGEEAGDDPGCYITIDPDGVADGDDSDDIKNALFVPSGSQSGFKANGPFTVPTNGTVEITADFDVRKSVVYSGNFNQGNGTYLLKPTISLIVNNQAGSITGTFTDDTTDIYDSYNIYAYESGTFTDDELTAADDESTEFPNAVTSIFVEDGSYTLAFLQAGTYDLIVVGTADDDNFTVVDQTHTGVEVISEEETTVDVNLTL